MQNGDDLMLQNALPEMLTQDVPVCSMLYIKQN